MCIKIAALVVRIDWKDAWNTALENTGPQSTAKPLLASSKLTSPPGVKRSKLWQKLLLSGICGMVQLCLIVLWLGVLMIIWE